MLIRELMTAPAVTVTAHTPVRVALRLLDDRKITAMPVVDPAGEIVGIVSEADLVQDAAPVGDLQDFVVRATMDTPSRRIAEVMSNLVVTVGPDDELDVAIDLMWSTMVKSLPVIDHGRVVGMISRSDVVHLLAGRDDRIRAEVNDVIRAENPDWEVDVHDGVVTVTGPADHPHERNLVALLVGRVRGVIAVRVR